MALCLLDTDILSEVPTLMPEERHPEGEPKPDFELQNVAFKTGRWLASRR